MQRVRRRQWENAEVMQRILLRQWENAEVRVRMRQ
jgi:hypothetical protein